MNWADLAASLPAARFAARGACAVAVLLLGLVGEGSTSAASDEAGAGAGPIDFEAEIRPILSDKCFHCHGPDAGNRKAGLRLDTPEGVFGETDSGGTAGHAGRTRGERASTGGSPPRTTSTGCRRRDSGAIARAARRSSC